MMKPWIYWIIFALVVGSPLSTIQAKPPRAPIQNGDLVSNSSFLCLWIGKIVETDGYHHRTRIVWSQSAELKEGQVYGLTPKEVRPLSKICEPLVPDSEKDAQSAG